MDLSWIFYLIILKQRKKQRKTPLRVLWKKRPSCSVNARVVFSNYAENFCQLCWKFPEVSSIVWAWYAFCSGMVISRNKFFACLQILHHIQHGGLRRMLYLCIRGEKRNVSICGRPENDWLLWLSKRYDEVGESDLEKRNVYIALHWAYILASFERRSNEMLYIEGGIGEISGLFIGYSPWTFPDRSHIQR